LLINLIWGVSGVLGMAGIRPLAANAPPPIKIWRLVKFVILSPLGFRFVQSGRQVGANALNLSRADPNPVHVVAD